MVGYVMVIYDYDIPVAKKLYENKGFAATGVEFDDEIELVMNV